MENMDLLASTASLTLENGRSPVAELNELTNAAARWAVDERNDDGMIKAQVHCWNQTFTGFGHNKRMAKNLAAKEALESESFKIKINSSKLNLNFIQSFLISNAYELRKITGVKSLTIRRLKNSLFVKLMKNYRNK